MAQSLADMMQMVITGRDQAHQGSGRWQRHHQGCGQGTGGDEARRPVGAKVDSTKLGGTTGYCFIADKSGVVIAHPDKIRC